MAKTEPEIAPEELARLKIVFALRRMAPELQSDVLSDGIVAARAGIALSHPIKLPNDITIERGILFSAFQKAADGQSISEIVDINGAKREMQVEIEEESAFLTYGKHRIRFPQGALHSASVEKRRMAAEIILKNNTLTVQARNEFKAIISKRGFSHSDFFAATTILLGSPESFADTLREVANKGTLSKADFIPSEIAHWENITAKCRTSKTLPEFIEQELAAERAARIALDAGVAIDVLSLTFGGPELVPLELMGQIDPEIMMASLRRLLDYADPFALSGAFDLCADRIVADERFVDLGDAILARLLSDPQRLRSELTVFATAFVIAGAHLAEHETLRKQPVFWRRLAAASHASLVTRILGPGSDDGSSLLTWAMRIAGKTFYLSVLNDAYVEPRWRPDWISPNFLVADIYGRLFGSFQRLGDAAPPSWRKKLDDAQPWVAASAPPIAHAFPAMLQGGLATPIERPAADTPVGEMYENLRREPTVENFLTFMQIVYAFGFLPDARESALKVVQSLRSEVTATPADYAQAALDLAAFIAARSRDAELADMVAIVSIERLVATQDIDHLLPTASVIVECAAAMADRQEAIATLARRLENLAFVAPARSLPEALDIFRVLQSIDEDLSPLLGRAIATARVGIPAISAS
ncbi:hypothetical protein IVB27_04845 [Bradyrhizobium sp. 197]|uniref:hypothetical protein n=1 Tax=Bradyrhizobium sp. 197 TaxID=2782663 RepID=UPI001FFA0E87|nr:hypothetical protein [Bradyrhizobium sp. 197]MCK1474156.1 hypothetical protein [Bradyrhizobium sp. 197]